jgi:hydrogenase-4 membrane subunit HyfE
MMSAVVTSPDQHKPGHPVLARSLGLGSAVVLLLLLIGNHKSHVEDLWLVGIALLLIAVFVVDWVLRRNGLRR